ncbi:uncharacterized protein ACRADG_010282 [Cochliomyia hominivorax]
MDCSDRYTWGIIIGALHAAVCAIVFLLMIVCLIVAQMENQDIFVPQDSVGIVALMVISLILALISGLLIWAIKKRRPNYMLPWLIIYAIYFGFSCLFSVYGFFGAAMGSHSVIEFLAFILITVLIIVLEVIIFVFMWKLYRTIYRENMEKSRLSPGNSQVNYQISNCSYTVVKNKP